MSETRVKPPYDQLLATAERVIEERDDVDPDIAREVFLEAATLLHNGLALDGLDEHDAQAVIAGLCDDLVSEDPGAAVQAHAAAALAVPGDLHDPEGVHFSYELSRSILQL